jgi:BirA family biotin operon repressor/biotin-[acetyl-CoA-carboxylase] ligase
VFEFLPPDLAAALAEASPRLGRFRRVRFRSEVESTNDLALALAGDGEPEGTVVLADLQRAGRGRRGRAWFSPPGAGLYASAILRPAAPPEGLPLVTIAAGVAAARAVRSVAALPVELKWPNDVVIGRPWRKLGGVLCEAAGSGSGIDAVVVGIGINLLHAAYPGDLASRATSIETELGRSIERPPVLVALLESLSSVVEWLHGGQHEVICDAWRQFARAGLGGAAVRWHDREGDRRGRARDIDHDGALLVESESGSARLVAGEVFWDGLSRE